MLKYQNMHKKILQHPDQIPFLQEFRKVRHETWRTNIVWKTVAYVLIKREYLRFFKTSHKAGWH